ncbi:MAG: MmyB family transcriptional regulator [Acidimicrobiales bacterium]
MVHVARAGTGDHHQRPRHRCARPRLAPRPRGPQSPPSTRRPPRSRTRPDARRRNPRARPAPRHLDAGPGLSPGPRFDFVAWNENFATLWDPAGLAPERRNVMWLAFADPAHRRTWVNWGDRSRVLLAEFRAAAGQHAGDPRFAELIDALNEASAEFRAWWSHYEVRQSITGPITLRHPGAGIIKLDVIELRVSAHPSLTLAVHVPSRPVDRKKLTILQA